MSSSAFPPGWGQPSGTQAGASFATAGDGRPVWIYAGFWWRVWAFLIDSIILTTVDTVLGYFILPDFRVKWEELPVPDSTGQTVDVVDIAQRVQPDTISVLIPHIQVGNWHLPGLLMALVPALYFILFESSRFRATPGKRLCQLEVTTLQGDRISVGRATVRFLIKALISFPILHIGVLMVAFTRHKQGLHDLIAGTLVLRAENSQIVTFNRRM
ncbi:RDD family protein [Acetobacter persici]|uniref:RDD family protein n=1 Tax=Acetobacter persici TaxID=1076596 RepID=UPI0039EC8C2D